MPPHPPSLSDRLSEWIDWTRAVALSRVLDRRPPAPEPGAPAFDHAELAAYEATRAALTGSIAAGLAASEPVAEATEPDYAAFRPHYLAMQRAMLTATGRWRGRLRDMLAGISPELARLAELDALMEVVLSPREHALLAQVPQLLGTHFERQRLSAQANDAAPSGAWLDVFRKDMHGVLLAELDVRFLPLEGLLAALRSHALDSHVQTSA